MTTEMIQQMSGLWCGGRNKLKARDRYTECSREALQMWIKGDSDRLYPQLKCIASTY